MPVVPERPAKENVNDTFIQLLSLMNLGILQTLNQIQKMEVTTRHQTPVSALAHT